MSPLLFVLFAAIAFSLAPEVEPAVVLPEGLDRLDPAVRELVLARSAEARADPGSARAHGRLGLAYEANLLWEEARLCFARAVALSPEDPGWRLHLAVARRETGDAPGALEALEELVAAAPSLAAAWQRLGLWKLEAGDADSAEAAFRRLIELLPDASEGFAGLGEVLLRRGDLEGAVRELREALERDPGNRSAHYLLGRSYRRLGRDEAALAELAIGADARVALVPDPYSAQVSDFEVNAAARIDRAEGLLAEERPREAAKLLEAVLEHDPGNVLALNKLAIAQAALGSLGAARASLQRALAADDSRASTYVNLAVWAVRSRLWDEALAYADAAVERGPRFAPAQRTRGAILIRIGRLAEATAALETALALDPRDPGLHLMLADTYARSDRPGEALERLTRAAQAWPQLLDVQLGLARLSLRMGRVELARTALETARGLSPEDPRIARLEARLSELPEPR
jgi:tetratricopeptide (TPR) repeat protein